MPDLKVTLLQTNLAWENPSQNRSMFSRLIRRCKDRSDLIILPEMFTTGFSMNAASLAEDMSGPTLRWMADSVSSSSCALTGSLIIKDNARFYNRLIWMKPDGTFQTYDKRHLFRMAGEDDVYSAGSRRLIVSWKGWRFCPLICYDLRFPVWSRSKGDFDVLIYIANWPSVRKKAWKILLPARAVENQSYTIGVNRIGRDGTGKNYSGDSAVYDPRGKRLDTIVSEKEGLTTVSLSKKNLNDYREKFPVNLDADLYEIKGEL